MSAAAWNPEQLFSSDRQDWETPQALFDVLDKEFNFALDAAATRSNRKCAAFLSEKDDALTVSWRGVLCDMGADPLESSIWLNPPYGRSIGAWIEKAYIESRTGATVVCLTFCRTDVRWWHQYAMKAAEVRLIPGRITFVGAGAGAPAPSCLLVFDEARRVPLFKAQELPRK